MNPPNPVGCGFHHPEEILDQSAPNLEGPDYSIKSVHPSSQPTGLGIIAPWWFYHAARFRRNLRRGLAQSGVPRGRYHPGFLVPRRSREGLVDCLSYYWAGSMREAARLSARAASMVETWVNRSRIGNTYNIEL